jgi:hypothetical protein
LARPLPETTHGPAVFRRVLWRSVRVLPQVGVGADISRREMAFYAERDAAYYRVVRSWTELLTKRRAVDFCRVATALCRTA